MATHVFTSVAANYIPKARVLANSIRKFHPDWLFHLLLCDVPPAGFSVSQEGFHSVIGLEDLEIPDLKSWLFKHDLVELSTAVKGFALKKILSLEDCSEALYFDPDIVVLAPLDHLVAEAQRTSILLTPHLSEPETTTKAIVDNELSVLRHGIYNLGFLAVRNGEEGQRFASWWADRLQQFCYDDIPRGLFTDQRWADLIPAYFPDHKVLRDAAYNVCTWNLTHRTVTGSLADGLYVNQTPLAFYHFSGFDSGAQQGMLDEYGRTMPALYELRDWYVKECERQGQNDLGRLPWSYEFFENGERILYAHRKQYRDSQKLQESFPNPFSQSYVDWLNLHRDAASHSLQARDSTESQCATQPAYRVLLLVMPNEAAYLADTLRSLTSSTFQSSELYVAAASDLSFDFGAFPSFKVRTFQAKRYENLFSAVLREFNDKDLLIVRAGASVPSHWDLRLAWTAMRQPGALSISPIDRRDLDPAGTLAQVDDKLLDRFCYWYRSSDDPEISSFSSECVFIRAQALQRVSLPGNPTGTFPILDRARRSRYLNLLATHVCVGWRSSRDPIGRVPFISADHALYRTIRDMVRSYWSTANGIVPHAIAAAGTQPNLHVMHSWGGGVERWLSDFVGADTAHENFVLRSFGRQGSSGSELRFYRHSPIADPECIESWSLEPVIRATAIEHEQYARILAGLLQQYGFGKIFVSTLIGQSLECLRTTAPTTIVCHDYFPFCSAINITFGEVCPSCEEPRLEACIETNPHNRFFPNVPAPEWLSIRSEFVRAIQNSDTLLVAPSASVRENYTRLLPDLADRFRVIPHGAKPDARGVVEPAFSAETRLRVLILGSMAIHKGHFLFESLIPQLLEFADVTLAGCFDYGEYFAQNPRLRVITSYKPDTLYQLVEEIRPDVGLLLSVVPETFSYTLREMQRMGIPPVATRLGSFVDFIQHGVTGFLCDPEPCGLISLLRQFNSDRSVLKSVHDNIKGFQGETPEDMVRSYHQLIEAQYSPRRYFDGPKAPNPLPERSVQLYWRTSEAGFSEAQSTNVPPRGLTRQIIGMYFVLSEARALELRLDLSREPGVVLLHRLRLLDAADEIVWTWDGDEAMWQTARLNQCFVLQKAGPGPGSLFAITGNDSSLILPIVPDVLGRLERGGCLEVEFTPDVFENHLPELSRAVLAGHEAEESFEQMKEQELRRYEELAGRLRERDALIEDLTNSVSWRLTKGVRKIAGWGRALKSRA